MLKDLFCQRNKKTIVKGDRWMSKFEISYFEIIWKKKILCMFVNYCVFYISFLFSQQC